MGTPVHGTGSSEPLRIIPPPNSKGTLLNLDNGYDDGAAGPSYHTPAVLTVPGLPGQMRWLADGGFTGWFDVH